MPRADLLLFLRSRQNLALPALTTFAFGAALLIGLATRGGFVSPRGAMFFAALLCALPAAWYARGFLLQRADASIALLLSSCGWALAALSFLMRAGNLEARAAVFFVLGAALLVLAGAALFLSSLLVGAATPDDDASTRAAKAKPDTAKKKLGDALRDARDL